MSKVDLHIHSKYSIDSFLEPKTILKYALKRDLSAIAVTDHNTIKGSLVTIHEASSIKDLIVIPGIEVKTDAGDLIGLYVQDEIKTREFQRVVEEIKLQGGLVILPHPYKRHVRLRKLIDSVDAVETLNSRSSPMSNAKASKLAKSFGKPAISCSDSHFAFEIGRVKTKFYSHVANAEELRKLILNGPRELVGKESPFIVHGFSFGTEIIKRLVDFNRG